MENVEEMIQVVRAAMQPGADAAARERAATVLRSVLAVVEAAPTAPLAPSGPDLLGALIDKLRAHLPAGAEVQVRPLAIPLVPVGKR